MEENKKNVKDEQKKENFVTKVVNNKTVRKVGRFILDLATIGNSVLLATCFISAAKDSRSSVKTVSTSEMEVKVTPTTESHD